MKKQLFNILWLFNCFLFSLWNLPASGQISVSHTVNFNPVEFLLTEQKAKDNNSYVQITVKGLQNTDDTGKPVLPVKYLNLIVPPGKRIIQITVNSVKAQSIKLKQPVLPVHRADPLVYSSDSPYPGCFVKVLHDGYYDGSNHIVSVAVYPSQYRAASKQLEIYSSVTFTLNFGKTISPIRIRKLKSASDTIHQKYINEVLKKMVENPDDIPVFQQMATEFVKEQGSNPVVLQSNSEWRTPFYEYAVITSADLATAFLPLINWKQRKGWNAGIVIIDSILADPANQNGDVISQINDPAGKLRQYLSEGYYNHSTQYVLLGGDSTILPIRYGTGKNVYCAGQLPTFDNKVPADLYFADFNGNWNVSQQYWNCQKTQGVYGQRTFAVGNPPYHVYGDSVDYFPEIGVGRLLCSTRQEVVNWVVKTLLYEQNPGNGDNSYLTKCFMTEHDNLQILQQAEAVAQCLPAAFTNTIWHEQAAGKSIIEAASARTKRYANGSPDSLYAPYASSVINKLKTHYGLYGIFNHGGPFGFGVMSD